MESKVKNLSEAVSVLIQVANLAQSKGVLSFDDAVITKNAIDFIKSYNSESETDSGSDDINGQED